MLSASALAELQRIFTVDALSTDSAECLVYGYDNSRRQVTPDAVVLPTTHEQVVALVRACRAHHVALTARGRGTNTTGASVPVAGGIVASFERMNRVLRIDPDNRLAVVDPADAQRLIGVVSRSDLLKPSRQLHEDEFRRERLLSAP